MCGAALGIRTLVTDGTRAIWHHPALWGLLPERTDPLPTVPAWPVFLEGCLRYRRSLDEQAPNAPRVETPYDDGREPPVPTEGVLFLGPREGRS